MDTQPDAWASALLRFVPGLAGAVVSLRWLPAETTHLGRGLATVGGMSAAMYVGPMLAELTSIQSAKGEAGLVFLTGLFGMMVAGELIAALRAIEAGPIIRDWLRRLFRLDRE